MLERVHHEGQPRGTEHKWSAGNRRHQKCDLTERCRQKVAGCERDFIMKDNREAVDVI